ncbi:uncharacterized protein [Dysidea avara]|uniref:uncharacterized protein n=1 Tax=Dysidea avara TaxID=196820 RepID=UPI003325EB2D
MANRETKTRKKLTYDVEEPPAYKDLYPQNVLIPASPPPYTASSTHSATSDQAIASSNATNVRVIIQPENSRSQQTSSRYQNQSQILAYSKEHDICGIFLIVLSCISMILTLPIGIHAFIWSCAAYHTDDKKEKNRYRSISIIVNIFSCLAMLTIVIAIPIAVIRAAEQD